MEQALVVVDMQRALCEGEEEAFDALGLIGRVNGLIARARAAGAPVVFVQHEEQGGPLQRGCEAWQIDGRLALEAHDARVGKTRPSSFEETRLREVLGEARQLVICGQQSDCCVDATVRAALALGYEVTLAGDGHSTVDSGGRTAAQIIGERNAALAAAGASVRSAAGIGFA